MIQHCHGYGGDHSNLPVVVLEDKHHVKILQAELDSLKVDELDVLQGADKRRPGGEVAEGARGWQQQDGLPVRHTLQNKTIDHYSLNIRSIEYKRIIRSIN